MGRWLFRTIFRAEAARRRYALDHAHDADHNGFRRRLTSGVDWSDELQRYIPQRGPVR